MKNASARPPEVDKRTWTLGDLKSARRHEVAWLDEAEGVAGTTITKLLWENYRQRESAIQRINICWFSAEVLTLPVQQIMTLERLLHRITSCRSAAAMPTCFLGRNRDCTRYMAEPAPRRCPKHIKSTAMGRGESTSQTFFHLPVRPTRSWHRPRHLGLSCHVLCHGLEDAMWWHSAVKQVPAARDPTSTS